MSVSKNAVTQQLHSLGDFHRFFTSREIGCLPDILAEGETIHGITSGFYEARTWIIVITDIRLIFLDKKFFVGVRQVDMPLAHISSISQKSGFFFGEIEVATSSGRRSITNLPRKNVMKISSIIAGLIHGDSTKVGIGNADLAQQFEKLENLWQKGALTDDEFARAKSKILGN